MSRHTLTASAHADHEDTRNLANTHHACRPGVDITIDYHPGFEVTALAALDAAYRDVHALITGRAQISRGSEDE